MTTFSTTFSLILTLFFTFFLVQTLFFTLSLYCFDFRANTYFLFANHGCPHKLSIKGCLNNTSLSINSMVS